MNISSKVTNSSGEVLKVEYYDIGSEQDYGDKKISGVHAYCFYGDKLVLVYSEKNGSWTPPGGSVESGEGVQEAVRREVQEETNMRVLKQRVIGYQDIHTAQGVISQTRSVCLVEPYGDFIRDPDEDITEIKLLDPKDYKEYFDWGEIGDHLMARALEIKAELELGAN